jgi:hypothetical protein
LKYLIIEDGLINRTIRLNTVSNLDTYRVIDGYAILKFEDDYIETFGYTLLTKEQVLNQIKTLEGNKVKLRKYTSEDNRSRDFRTVNYKTGLTKNLFPDRVFTKGELNFVGWYSDEAKTDLVIQVTIAYIRDSLGFATSRTTTREWLDDTGQVALTKTSKKEYDDIAQIKEGVTRRGNIIKGLQKPTLGMLIATEPALPNETEPERQNRLILEGRTFLANHKQAFTLFEEDSNRGVSDDITNATEPWLDNIIDGNGTTIRAYILNELDIGGVA